MKCLWRCVWGGEKRPWIERSSKDISTKLQHVDFEAVGGKELRKVVLMILRNHCYLC